MSGISYTLSDKPFEVRRVKLSTATRRGWMDGFLKKTLASGRFDYYVPRCVSKQNSIVLVLYLDIYYNTYITCSNVRNELDTINHYIKTTFDAAYLYDINFNNVNIDVLHTNRHMSVHTGDVELNFTITVTIPNNTGTIMVKGNSLPDGLSLPESTRQEIYERAMKRSAQLKDGRCDDEAS